MGEMMNIQKKVRERVDVCLGESTAVLSIWFCFPFRKIGLVEWFDLCSSSVVFTDILFCFRFNLLGVLIRETLQTLSSGNVPKHYELCSEY